MSSSSLSGMAEAPRLKILVSAFAASPGRGSEHAVGWEWACSLARHYEVWVITRDTEKQEILEYLRHHENLQGSLHFAFVAWSERSSHTSLLHHFIYRLRYVRWQRDCYALAINLHAQHKFDLAHHLNGTGFREPGLLWKLDIPFVWGPIGGLQYFPLRMRGAVSARDAVFFLLKNLSTWWMMHIASRPRLAARRAAVLIAATAENAGRIRSLWERDAVILSEVTAPRCKVVAPVPRNPEKPLRILWCGGLDARKALIILLKALGRISHVCFDWELIVLGTGALEGASKMQARALGIADRCRFMGNVSRSEVIAQMQSGHIFAHTCLYELTGTVTVEALQAGLPVLCFEHLAISQIIRQYHCGVAIAPQNMENAARGFSAAIQLLAEDEELRLVMAKSAQRAAVDFAAEVKEAIITEAYSRSLVPQVQGGGSL